MPRQLENINQLSPADIVQAIDALAERGRRGEDVNDAVCLALDMLDASTCRTVSDAAALMSVVQMLLQDLGSPEAMERDPLRLNIVETAMRYQFAALSFLTDTDAHRRSEAIRNGATVN